MAHNLFNSLQEFNVGPKRGKFYTLAALEAAGPARSPACRSRFASSESVLRNCDGVKSRRSTCASLQAGSLARADADSLRRRTCRAARLHRGSLLADLAAMRNVAATMGKNANDRAAGTRRSGGRSSVMVDHYGTKDALDLKMKLEFQSNRERYEFMKWGMQAFDTFGVVPPGFGIVIRSISNILRAACTRRTASTNPDTLVARRHTTMITHRSRRLGGWRNRSRSRHARSAVYFHARRRRCAPKETARRRDRDRPVLSITELLRKAKVSASSSSSSVRYRESCSARSRADRQHGARIRCDDGIFPGRRKNHLILRRHGSHTRRTCGFRSLLSRTGVVRYSEGRRDRLLVRRVARSGLGCAVACRTEAPAGPDRDRQREARVHAPLFSAGARQRIQSARSAPVATVCAHRQRRACGLGAPDAGRRAAGCGRDEGQRPWAARPGTRRGHRDRTATC